MQIEKKTAEHTVFKRGDGRYAVKGKSKKFINGEDKIKILMAEGFLKAFKPKAEEAPAEASEESGDTEKSATAE